MHKTTLPARPSLEQLKKQAKELLAAVRDNDVEAAALSRSTIPSGPSRADALLCMMRSWFLPDNMASPLGCSSGTRSIDLRLIFSQRVGRFVRDAVDGNFARARHALMVEPELARADWWTALATGDLSIVERTISLDPARINRIGGPCENWAPLLYVSFSRFQMEDAGFKSRMTRCAELLLDAGADPNVSWIHPSWENSPLKPLYGATGVNNNPSLARLLLERGAEVNDGESIYHAAQFDHRECLEVLTEFGVSLGRHPLWNNTPLYFLLGMLRDQGGWDTTARGIRWLLDRGSDPNVPCGENDDTALHLAVRQGHDPQLLRWLLEAGADPNRQDKDGVLPIRLAHLAGRADTIALLRDYGANEVELSEKERFFEAVFSNDGDRARALLRPALVAAFEEEDRLALNRSAEHGNVGALRILLDCGFDTSFKGARNWGSTPLHGAAWYGQAEIVELLLSRGSPIDIPANPPEESLPLGWAAHGSTNCAIRMETTSGAFAPCSQPGPSPCPAMPTWPVRR
ncbi:MAG TPA: ankyrin repeat domain-containing protein [Terrimicrobiaceae bacterium]